MRPLLVVVMMLVLAAPTFSQGPDDKRIVPGKRIGKWTLEMTIADFERVNGPPTRRILFRAGDEPFADFAHDLTQVSWAGILVRAWTADLKTVLSLFFRSDISGYQLYKTDKGISLESTRNQVLKSYGKPTAETKPERAETTLIYDKLGIAFRVFVDGTMRGILIFRPGTAKSIWKF